MHGHSARAWYTGSSSHECKHACNDCSTEQEGYQSKLLFKKRMFRETDETITEPQFINLSYVQAQHDYLQVRACTRMCNAWCR